MNTHHRPFPQIPDPSTIAHAIGVPCIPLVYPHWAIARHCDMQYVHCGQTWKSGCAVGSVDECFNLEAAQWPSSGRDENAPPAECFSLSLTAFDLVCSEAKLRRTMDVTVLGC